MRWIFCTDLVDLHSLINEVEALSENSSESVKNFRFDIVNKHLFAIKDALSE